MTLQKLIAEIKSLSDFTDKEIADKVNVTQSTITRLKNGDHNSTSYETGLKIKLLAESLRPEAVSLNV
jgi:transcriptional regulator with XRE-family HTH domain